MKKVISILLVMIMLFTLSFGTISANADVGDYTMDEVEPNSTMGYADRIYNDYTVSGYLDAYNYDLDYFKFILSSTAQVSVICACDWSSMCMGILNSNDDFLATATYEGYTDNGNHMFTITATLSAGTYYLVLFDEDDYGYNDYMFYFEYASAHTHLYSPTVIAPTCVDEGYTEYTCSCGSSYTDNYTQATGIHTIFYAERLDSQWHSGYCESCCEYVYQNHIYDDILDTRCNSCSNTRAAFTGTALTKNLNGEWVYIVNGAYSNATTLVKHNNEWWYVKNGKLCRDNTLFLYNGQWYHVNNGKWVKDTTLVKYNNEWFYVSEGRLSRANTLCLYGGQWYHVNGGKWVKDTTLVKYNNEWFYVKGGRLCRDNTLFLYNGQWYHVNNGKWVKDTTLVKYNNEWFYVSGGRLNRANTLCLYGGQWYHVNNGKWVKDTTLVKYNGTYYYVRNGRVDFNFTGKIKYNGKYYKVTNGRA